MYFRFVIGSDEGKNAMIGFTVQEATQLKAIRAAQKIADGLSQRTIDVAGNFAGNIGNKTIDDTDAFSISIYAGNDTLITEDNIEDSWDDALGEKG